MPSINPGPAREHYRRRRDHGDGHAAALRHLFNKMIGQLYHCLQTGQTYDPIKAFGHTLHSAGTGCCLTVSGIGGLWIIVSPSAGQRRW